MSALPVCRLFNGDGLIHGGAYTHRGYTWNSGSVSNLMDLGAIYPMVKLKLEKGIESITEPKCPVFSLRLYDTVTKSQSMVMCSYLSKFIHAPPVMILFRVS